jgi:hypothetical protein
MRRLLVVAMMCSIGAPQAQGTGGGATRLADWQPDFLYPHRQR